MIAAPPAPAESKDEQWLDPVAMERLFHVGRARSERVGYYRLPRDFRAGAPLWITWGDTQPGIRLVYMDKGWMPLPQYGFVTTMDREGRNRPPAEGWAWAPILSKERGRAEFPSSQVLTYRWYRPECLPAAFRGQTLRFPQLEKAFDEGLVVNEYRCPECHDIFFFEPFALASHLRNKHGYDRTDVIAIGREVGIDFQEAMKANIRPARVVRAEDFAPPEAETPTAEQAEALLTRGVVRHEPQATRGATLAPGDDLLGMMAEELRTLRQEMAEMRAGVRPLPGEPKPKRKRVLSDAAKETARNNLAVANQRRAETQITALRERMQEVPVGQMPAPEEVEATRE